MRAAHETIETKSGIDKSASDGPTAPAGRSALSAQRSLGPRIVAAYVGAAALILGLAAAAYFAAIYVDTAPAPAPVAIHLVGRRLVAGDSASAGAQLADLSAARSLELVSLAVALVAGLILTVAAASGNGSVRPRLWPRLAVFSALIAAVSVAALVVAANGASGGISTAIGQLESNAAVLRGRPTDQGVLQNGGMDVAVMASPGAAAKWQAVQSDASKSAVQRAMNAPGSFLTADGSHVRLLSRENGYCCVRIESGARIGTTGWVPTREFARQ